MRNRGRKAKSLFLVVTLIAMMFKGISDITFAVNECTILDVYTDKSSCATTNSEIIA